MKDALEIHLGKAGKAAPKANQIAVACWRPVGTHDSAADQKLERRAPDPVDRHDQGVTAVDPSVGR